MAFLYQRTARVSKLLRGRCCIFPNGRERVAHSYLWCVAGFELWGRELCQGVDAQKRRNVNTPLVACWFLPANIKLAVVRVQVYVHRHRPWRDYPQFLLANYRLRDALERPPAFLSSVCPHQLPCSPGCMTSYIVVLRQPCHYAIMLPSTRACLAFINSDAGRGTTWRRFSSDVVMVWQLLTGAWSGIISITLRSI